MRKHSKTSFIASAMMALFSIVLPSQAKADAPELGKSAPAFSLVDVDGKKHSLKDYAGKTVVLEWINFDCPFVRKHYDSGNMQKIQQTEKGNGVVWFSVLSSAKGKQGYLAPKEMKAQLKKEKSNASATLYDTDGKVGKAYAAKTTPHLYIIDGQGVLRYKGGIDDKPSTDIEDVATAKNYVTLALKELRDGKPVSDSDTKPYGCGVKYQ